MKRSAIPFLFLTACVAEEVPLDDAWTETGKADEPSTGGVTLTHAANARLLDGFHKLLDTSTDACVEPVSAGAPYTVGAIEKPFDLHFVASKQDLAKTLGIDVGLQIRYAGATIGPTVSFLDSFQQTKSSIHLLVAARASYRVTNLRSVRLTTDASEWLEADPRAFLHRCGNFFINGVQHEAQLFVMIRLDTLSEDATRAINADLGIGGATAALGIDANVKAKLERIAKRNDVVIETHVLDRGFLVDGGTGALIAELSSSGLSSATFQKIDAVRAAMLASINEDVCRDGGIATATCTSTTPGYADNTTRHALPVKVDLRPYSRAANAPLGGPGSPYEQMRHTVDRANAYLRGVSSAAVQLDRVRDENRAFLESPRKTLFGIAPPAAPVWKPEALAAVATRARDEVEGARAGVAQLLATCWSSAVEGALELCATPDGTSVATLPAVAEARSTVARYLATARVVPLRFASRGVLGYAGAKDACAASAMRLPTFAEAQRLAIPIGYGAFPRTTEDRLRYAAWHANTSMCSGGDLSAFANAPNGTAQNVCTAEGWWTPHPTLTLCVPPAGPFDDLPPL